jgi:DinB family protein
MSELRYRASDAQDQAQAYIAAILAALGSRDPLDVLREMPAALRRAIEGLSPEQIASPEAPAKWSMLQVIQHLSDSDLIGGFRFRMVLAHDSPTLAGYDQDLWVERVHRNDTDVEAALNEFTAFRRANVRLLERTTPEERERVSLHAERGPESLGHMIRLYAGHDVVHLRQLARIRRAVAPAAT